ncbi:mCG1030043 [Mus musculus]|nr:mCG1030043 [Mus musculus]
MNWETRTTDQLWSLKVSSKGSAEIPFCCTNTMGKRSDLSKDQGQSYPPAPYSALSFAYQIYRCRPAAHRHGLQTVADPLAHWRSRRAFVNLYLPLCSGNSLLSTKRVSCVPIEAVTCTANCPLTSH